MKKIYLFFILGLFILVGASCNSSFKHFDIMTSCFPIYDFTSRIAGDKMTVGNLVKAGVEPHDYEPSTKDVRNLVDCKMFVVTGLGLESYLNDLPKDIQNKTFVSTTNIELIYENNVCDPHVWLDVNNAITMMRNIKDKLVEIDSANASYYENNYKINEELFLQLDNEYKSRLVNLSSPYLITSHQAFGYLCKAYGLTQIAINGLSTEDEPTSEAIAKLIDEIKGLNAKTIFYEELVSDSIAKSIASQTGLECDVLNPLEGLEDEKSEEDYLSLMRKNLEAIIKALA